MADGFVVKREDVERIEAELFVLDYILRETAGPGARFERCWNGLPCRVVERWRPDGVTFGVIVAPIIHGPLGPAPVRYTVTPFAHVKMGGLEDVGGEETAAALQKGEGGIAGREGEVAGRRQVPVWTIELARPESLHQARAAIAEAWGCGSTVRREEILDAGEESGED